MQYLRSLLFTVLMSVSVLPYAAWVLLAAPFGRSACYRVAVRWVRLNLWLLRALCGLDHEVAGTENIPAEGTCVVYLKHSSTWETFAELLVFPEQTWVLKRELFWLPLFGWALAALRPVGINRGARSAAVRQVVAKGALRLNAGMWVMIFPEGTRMAPGQTRRYGLSGALLAIKTGHCIVPVAHNAGDFWPRHSLLKKPGTIKMVVGPPIETAGRDPKAINEEAQAWIEGTMQQISSAYADRMPAAG